MPMPRVIKIMPQFWGDRRLRKLEKSSASFAEAVGKSVEWFSLAASYYVIGEMVPKREFDRLGYPELIDCELAELLPTGCVRCFGDHEHFEWLRIQAQKGKNGANKRWQGHSTGIGTGKLVLMGSDSLERRTKNEEREIHTSTSASDVYSFVSIWNDNCSPLPRCTKLTSKRKAAIKSRLSDCPDLEYWAATISKMAKSEFCRSGKWATLDWITKNDTNHVKVSEGNYDNNPGSDSSGSLYEKMDLKEF